MKPQARLRLRQAPKHCGGKTFGTWEWTVRQRVRNNLSRAFEMNCMPKHSTDGLGPIGYTMDYVTGKTTFHAPEILQPHAFVDMQFQTLLNRN